MSFSKPLMELSLPIWAKVISWILLLQLGVVPLLFVYSFYKYADIERWNFFGIPFEGSSTSLVGIGIQLIFFIGGLVAFGILRNKKWGNIGGIFWSILAIIVWIVGLSYNVSSAEDGIDLRLFANGVFQIPLFVFFALALNKVRKSQA